MKMGEKCIYRYANNTEIFRHIKLVITRWQDFLLFKDFIYLDLEKGEGREKERERNINV